MNDDDPTNRRSNFDDEFIRLPGLFRRWEIADVMDAGNDFHLEEAGDTSDGTPLFAMYRRERTNPNPNLIQRQEH